MRDILALFILILISYFVYIFLFNIKEHYVTTIVGYNNIAIPSNYIPSLFDSETKELMQVFNVYFPDDNVETLGYKEHNPYIPFPFEASIKKMIIDFLKTNIDRFKGHKLEITSNLNKVYFKNDRQDRIFIFNINLVDNTKFMTRNLKFKIKIKDIRKFIKDESDYVSNSNVKVESEIDYRTNIPMQTVINATSLLSIRLDKNNYARFEFKSLDSLQPNYYQINNVLGLMDPFMTSGQSMIVSSKMKQDFDKIINERRELLKSMT